jgi:plasmid stabilization system protein ParE
MIPVRFSVQALADLEDIAAYLEARNPAAARRVINRIEELCFALGEMPGLGRPSEVAGARKLLVPKWPYKIICEIGDTPDRIVILRIYHGARDLHY